MNLLNPLPTSPGYFDVTSGWDNDFFVTHCSIEGNVELLGPFKSYFDAKHAVQGVAELHALTRMLTW